MLLAAFRLMARLPLGLAQWLGRGLGWLVYAVSGSYRRKLHDNLARAGLPQAQVRHGDMYNLSLPDASADAVVMHQVLHYLSEPGIAIAEAARVLVPGGKLLIVDFAPHEQEFLRSAHAHERLGFGTGQIGKWCAEAGLAIKTTKELKPARDTAGQLTVMVWLAERPAAHRRPAKPNEASLEEIR
jgi:ArsR family transcriptional regulator